MNVGKNIHMYVSNGIKQKDLQKPLASQTF